MCLCPQLSCQMVEMFEACQQQASDLDRKELCRTRLQDDIQGQYPGVYEIHNHAQTSCRGPFSLGVFLTVARLYLTGSSMNGLGCRSSDADMCLIIKGNVSCFDCILCLSSRMCTIRDAHFLFNTYMFFLFLFIEKTRSY